MSYAWAWIGGAASAGLIGAGLWLGTIEQELRAIETGHVPAPDLSDPPAPVVSPEPEPESEPEPSTPQPAPAPVLASSGGVWLYGLDPRLPADVAEAAMHLLARTTGQADYFGAAAVPRAYPTSQYVIEGYGELAQAEKHALATCAQSERDCIVLAWLVPPDWDGSYEGTVNARQQSLFDTYVTVVNGPFLAFASSLEGAAGIGQGADPEAAAQAALSECARVQDSVQSTLADTAGCHIMATRQTGP